MRPQDACVGEWYWWGSEVLFEAVPRKEFAEYWNRQYGDDRYQMPDHGEEPFSNIDIYGRVIASTREGWEGRIDGFPARHVEPYIDGPQVW